MANTDSKDTSNMAQPQTSAPASPQKEQNILGDISDSDLYLDVNIRSRTKTFFHGKVKSISAINKTGLFDILPLHANFITLVSKYLILDKGTSTEKKIDFYTAVVSVMGTRVEVYVGV